MEKKEKSLNCSMWAGYYVSLISNWKTNRLDSYQGEEYIKAKSTGIRRMHCFKYILNCYTINCNIEIFCMNGLPCSYFASGLTKEK